MAVSAVLRRAEEPPPPPPRSAERQALAEAVEQHRVAAERLQRLQTALSRARTDASDRFSEAERAEEALSEARRREPHRRAAALLSEAAPDGPSVAEAQERFAAARSAYDSEKDVAGFLEAEINGVGGAEFRVSLMQSGVERALAAVLAADPALAQLVEAFDAARAEVAALGEVFKYLGLTRLPNNLQSWFAENRPLPPRLPLTPLWQGAIGALLRGEIDTPLPGT